MSECNAFRDAARVFDCEQFFHSPVDRIRRVFHALSQVDSVRLKQCNIKKFAPAFGVIRSHDVTPMLTSYRDTSGLILALNSNLPRETGDEASHASSFGAY